MTLIFIYIFRYKNINPTFIIELLYEESPLLYKESLNLYKGYNYCLL